MKVKINKHQLLQFLMMMVFVVIPLLTLFLMATPFGGTLITTQQLNRYAITYIYFGSVTLIWFVYLYNYVKQKTIEQSKYLYAEILLLSGIAVWIISGIIISILTLVSGVYAFHPIIYFILSVVSSMTLGVVNKMSKS